MVYKRTKTARQRQNEKSRLKSFKMTDSMAAALAEEADRAMTSEAHIMRLALYAYLFPVAES